jgi:hypothetical protein
VGKERPIMNRRIRILSCCLVLSALFLAGCGGRYDDAKKANEQYVRLLERYVADMESSETAQDVADGLNRFSDGMEKLWPTMKQITEKYPEMKQKDTMPKELQALEKRADVVSAKMGNAMMKIMPHISDPEVLKAQQRFEAVMSDADAD